MPAPEGIVSYCAALRAAMHDCLARDDQVFCYGQDIQDPFGGAFKVTKGLSTAFPGRVRNAPVCEDAMAGLCIGAALGGMRPVLEYQFADFAIIACNQLVNSAAAAYWRMGQAVPLTVRLPSGGTLGGGPYHSQLPDNWLVHHPGLVVLAPGTVSDAYHMLRQAIMHDDPVVVCEHKQLYFHAKGTVAANSDLPLGKARIHRAGSDCTVVAWGALVEECNEAAIALERDYGIRAEIIDLRCIKPIDSETVLSSVARTAHLLVVTEDFPYGSVAAELSALVSDQGFTLLDAPVRRLCSRETPVPFHPDLWHEYRPQVADVVASVRNLLLF